MAADKGLLLIRMLERMRLTATAPHDALIDLVAKDGSFSREELAAHFRLPYPQYWLPLLVVLYEHAAEATMLAPISVARVALAWLLDMVDRRAPEHAGRLAVDGLVIAPGKR